MHWWAWLVVAMQACQTLASYILAPTQTAPLCLCFTAACHPPSGGDSYLGHIRHCVSCPEPAGESIRPTQWEPCAGRHGVQCCKRVIPTRHHTTGLNIHLSQQPNPQVSAWLPFSGLFAVTVQSTCGNDSLEGSRGTNTATPPDMLPTYPLCP